MNCFCGETNENCHVTLYSNWFASVALSEVESSGKINPSLGEGR